MEGTPGYFSLRVDGRTVDALIRAGGNVLMPPFDMVAGRMAVVGHGATTTPRPAPGRVLDLHGD
jgi:hypothetical protein